jgi:hypothetical protein
MLPVPHRNIEYLNRDIKKGGMSIALDGLAAINERPRGLQGCKIIKVKGR